MSTTTLNGTASSSGKVILVTGINGYIASHIGLIILQHGHRLRGTARSTASHTRLLSEAFKGYESNYEPVVIPDMTIPGAFDEAVGGVQGIIHVASPIDFSLKTVDDFFGPAISSVLGILESVKSLGSNSRVESFVLTSSISAIVDKWRHPPPPDGLVYHYTEQDWNTSGEAVARRMFTAPVAYGASKAVAERNMWEWRTQQRPTFSMSAVNPAVVTGPPVTWPDMPDGLNVTLQPVWKIWSGQSKRDGILPPPIGMGAYVDVRDVARLHVWCVENPASSDGQRYLATNGLGTPEMMNALLKQRFPEREGMMLPGEWKVPGEDYEYGWPEGETTAVASKMYDVLGGKESCKRFDESVIDTVEAFEKRWPGLKVSQTVL